MRAAYTRFCHAYRPEQVTRTGILDSTILRFKTPIIATQRPITVGKRSSANRFFAHKKFANGFSRVLLHDSVALRNI